jgi:hypothetical protein
MRKTEVPLESPSKGEKTSAPSSNLTLKQQLNPSEGGVEKPAGKVAES